MAMANRRRRDARVFWGTVFTLLPLMYLGSLAPRGAMPIADGCTGGSPSTSALAPTTGVYSLIAPGELPVDSRGFFSFWVVARELEAGAALGAVSLEVKDTLGKIVAGQTRILTEEQFGDVLELNVAWEADATLPSGTVLEVNATATSSNGPVSMKAVLTVQDQVLALPEPELKFEFWNEVTRDAGELQTCVARSSCSNSSQSFGADLEQVVEVSLTAPVPASPVAVAWHYRIAEIEGKGSFVHEPASWTFFLKQDASEKLGARLTFAERLDEYCVLVTAVDLRTEKTESSELCGRPPTPLESQRQDAVELCLTAPAGFTERWCQGPGRQSAPECAPAVVPGGAGSSGAGPADSTPTAAAPTDADESDESRRTSEAGCAVAASGTRGSLLAFGTLTLFALCALRRRRRCAG
jgi:hypothetical protein